MLKYSTIIELLFYTISVNAATMVRSFLETYLGCMTIELHMLNIIKKIPKKIEELVV